MSLRSRSTSAKAARRAERRDRAALIAAIPGAIAKPEPTRGTSYRRRDRDLEYMADVKTLRCYIRGEPGAGMCHGVVEADHAGDRPYGRKCPDDETIPLCERHHKERTNPASYPGCYFDRFRIVGPRMRAWCERAILRTQMAVAELRARRKLEPLP